MKTKIITILLAAALAVASVQCNNAQNDNTSKTTKTESAMDIATYHSPNPEGMQRVVEAVKECHYYFIATADGDQPQVRPFSSFDIYNGNLYILTGHSKNVGRQIDANPKVAICAMGDKGVIRITATLVEDSREEVQAAIIGMNSRFASMYTPGDGNTAVYALTNAVATLGGETINF